MDFRDNDITTEDVNSSANVSYASDDTDKLSAENSDETKNSIKDEDNRECENQNHFNGYDFSHSLRLQNHIRATFKLEKIHDTLLRPINAVLLGHNCFVTMSSASGKSLIYQLPAVMMSGVTVVISPYISVITDQVNKLKELSIVAKHVEKGVENDKIYEELEANEPKIKIIYLTPEKIVQSPFVCEKFSELYDRDLLVRIVVDDVQCMVQHAEGFRGNYSKLYELRNLFPKVPWTLLTGAISVDSKTEIVKQLHFNDPVQYFSSSINRPNLRYIVVDKTKNTEIGQLINMKYKNMSGIIYCLYKWEVDMYTKKLGPHGITASSYHSDIRDEDKRIAQRKWMADEVQVICATIAFRMGIDKPNVRFIIHASLPRSIEQYQEDCGHAGRDGGVADCVLYYDELDVQDYLRIVGGKKQEIVDMEKMVAYCEDRETCRRELLLNHCSQSFLNEKCSSNDIKCDNCEMKVGNRHL